MAPPSSSKSPAEGESAQSQQNDSGDNASDPGSPKTAHLSEEQKKANHIASEKKRRTNIREQYDKLAEMTPGMEGQGRSEGRVLEEVVKHGKRMQEERDQLIRDIERKGGTVPDSLKRYRG